MTVESDTRHDVVVIGGGAAGLSGALVLARAGRSVVVIDSGKPRNATAEGIHGFLTRDGMSPAEFLATGRREVTGYGGQMLEGRATSLERCDHGFVVRLEDGGTLHARKLLVGTGLVDEFPEVGGLRERWGRDVLQCPYCHGWEVRGKRIGVLAHPDLLVEQALLFSQWSPFVTLFMHVSRALTDEERERLDARGISVEEAAIDCLEVEDDRLVGVRLVDGSDVALDVFALEPRVNAGLDLLAEVGLTPEDHPMGKILPGSPPADSVVPGVWLAGNVTDLGAQVVGAAADGARAAIGINSELLQEDVQSAVDERRRAANPGSGRRS